MTITADKKINNSSQILLNSEFHLFLAPSPLLPDLKFLFSLAKNCKKTLLHFLTEGVELKIVVTVTQASKTLEKIYFCFDRLQKKLQ